MKQAAVNTVYLTPANTNEELPFQNQTADGQLEDPLAGAGSDVEKPTYYRLDEQVFAEPVPLPDTQSAPEPSEEFIFYNSVVVQKVCGKRTKYHIDIKDESVLRCPQKNCRKPFSNKTLLKAHVRRVHCSDRSRYQCDACYSSFPSKYLLIRHTAVHTNAKRECPICHKMLSLRTCMSLHMKSHSNERRFTCDMCAKGFITRASLTTHVSYIHRNSFGCERCNVGFKKRVEYKRHMAERHARVKRLECEICGGMFSTNGALGSHRAKKHEMTSFQQN